MPLSLLRCPASGAARRPIDFLSGRDPVACLLVSFAFSMSLSVLHLFTGVSDSALNNYLPSMHGTSQRFDRGRVVRRMQPSCDCSATQCEWNL
ncbi:hypothetical protein LY78DRAFT_374502 [Colletotrichum sublineola]|nr:hypothetical protein LY78DRAFT_374502 [Colletotrichum sublineola]